MKGDKDIVFDCSVAWATSSRLCDLPSNREDSVLVGNEPPNGVTSLERKSLKISNRSRATLDSLGLAPVIPSRTEWFGVGGRHQRSQWLGR